MPNANMIRGSMFIAKDGESCRLLRSKDWSSSALGEPDHWPASLKITLNLLLNSTQPMFMWWGPQSLTFYNDPFIPLMGTGHPAAIGAPAASVWADKWDAELISLRDAVLAGETISRNEHVLTRNEHGNIEKKYFNFFYSPIYDEKDEAVGLICCCDTDIKDTGVKPAAEGSSPAIAGLDALAILESSADAIIIETPTGIITSFNPAAEKLLGYTTEEIAGQPMRNLLAPECRTADDAILEQLRRGEIVNHVESVFLHKSGDRISISQTVSAIRKNDSITYIARFARDINELKKKVSDISNSEQKFRDLLMQAPVGVLILRGRQLIVEMANSSYLEIVDRTEEQLVGRPLYDSLPEVKEFVDPLFMGVLNTGESYYGNEFGVTLNRRGGPEFAYFNFIYKALRDAGNAISGVIVIANEVSEEVNAKHLLAESEREFRRMVTHSPIAMTIFSGPEFIIEVANEAMLKEIWRREPAEVLGKKAFDVFPELLDQKYSELLQAVLASGEVHRERESLAFVKGSDGIRKFYLDFEYAPLFEADGSISRIMITANDVTDQVNTRHRLEDAEERLRMAAEGTGLATWDLNIRTTDIIYSAQLNEIYGYLSDSRLTHAELRSRVYADDVAAVEAAYQQALQTGVYDYMARIVKFNDEICWVRTQGRVYFENGFPVRMIGTMRDITEQRNIQKAIEESESRLNIAIDAAELGTWELNFKTGETNCSARCLVILGFEETDSPSHLQMVKSVHPDDRALREAAIRKALVTGALDMEIRVVHPDYSVHWVKGRGKVFYDLNGVAERMLGTVMDITQQETTILHLQESEERFRTIANNAPVMIWMSGTDRFSDFFNTSWLRFTGRKLEQEIGDGWLEAVHPDDVRQCVATYQGAFIAQEPFYAEYRLLHADGEYRWISDNAVPRFASDGRFIGFISACMDIDVQKRSIEKVMESELLFKTITNVSPVALWMTNAVGQNTFVNDTWKEWTGFSSEMQMDPREGWMRSVVEADKEYVIKSFSAASKANSHFAAEFRILRQDGRIRWVLSEGSPYYDIDGSFAGYAGSVLDITERKQDEMRKNEFLAVASHELKTPLTSIKAYTQLLDSTYAGADDAFLKNALGKVGNQVNRMTKLVNDFLNLSKIESGKFKLNKEHFNLSELLREVVSEIQLVTANHSIVVNDSAALFIHADREKIAQVITNLLNNAIKYSPENNLVEVAVEKEKDEARLSVTDHGIGINKDEHERIFERFYRSEFNNNISFSGFGIGLYISAEIINSHAGHIGVRSEEGKGSTFYFTLPVSGK